jgi:hypothetical protein
VRAELGLAAQGAETADRQREAVADELADVQSRLQEALRRAERAEAEVEITRRLIPVAKKALASRAAPKQVNRWAQTVDGNFGGLGLLPR